jgi:hypothetical protein
VPYNKLTTLLEEAVSAARGLGALVVGDGKAPSYFDFTLRGLVGSFIAFLVAAVGGVYLPQLAGTPPADDAAAPAPLLQLTPGSALLLVIVAVGIQALATFLILRIMKRPDGLIRFLVADNWSTFFTTIIAGVIGAIGIGGDFVLLVLLLVLVVVEINIARLILAFKGWQIAAFIVAQKLALFIGLVIVLSPFLPAPPDTASLS